MRNNNRNEKDRINISYAACRTLFQGGIYAGLFCKEGEYLLAPVRKYVGEKAFGAGLLPEQKIVVASLGNDAGLIGAALLHA